MGRGSSGRVATRSASRASTTPMAQQRMTPQELDDFFQRASDSDADQMLNTWRQERMDNDNRSNDNDVQRFFHYSGWSENTPEVLNETQFQAAWNAAGRPQKLYHADKAAGGASAQDFATQYFGNGYDFSGNRYRHYISNGYYGGGTYFANSAIDSSSYGTNQFRGFLNNNARVVKFGRLKAQYDAYVNSHPAFGRMMRNVRTGYGGDDEKLSIFAAMKGYNVIDEGSGYYVVLDRRATTVSNKTRSTRGIRSNW